MANNRKEVLFLALLTGGAAWCAAQFERQIGTTILTLARTLA